MYNTGAADRKEHPLMRPTGMLVNLATHRFHPIVFSFAPLPGGAELHGGGRYRSHGHHTEGFEMREQADAWATGRRDACVQWAGTRRGEEHGDHH
jgi:hypothetical protein